MNQFLNLVLPILLSNIVLALAGVVDIALLGHFSATHVAAFSVALTLYSIVYVMGVGLLQGVLLKLSEAYGAKESSEIKRIFLSGTVLMILSSMFGVIVMWLLSDSLIWFGATLAVEQLTQQCLVLMCLLLPIQLLFRLCTTLSQVTNHAKKVLLSDSLFFLLKVILSIAFIFGIEKMGMPAMGAIGAVLATLLARLFMLAIYMVFFLEKQYLREHLQSMHPNEHWVRYKKILKIGLPTSVVALIDVVAFCSVALLILPFGEQVSAAHQIVVSITALLFIIPSSMSAAFTILVSRKIGAQLWQGAEQISRYAILNSIGISSVLGLILFWERQRIAEWFSNDIAVVQLASSLLLIVAIYHIFDGLLNTYSSLLRCWDIALLPMLIFLVFVLGFGLGGGWWMAFQGWHWGGDIPAMGVYGFWSVSVFSYGLAAFLCMCMFQFKAKLKGF